MKTRICAQLALMTALGFSGTAQAVLQGRDLNGSAGSFEAYYDTVLDITWLADANYAQTTGYDDSTFGVDTGGRMSWAAANTWAANLSIVDSVNNITYDNWRLPTVEPVNGTSFNTSFSSNGSTDIGYNNTSPNNEIAYMFYVNLGNPGYYTPSGVVSGCFVSIYGDNCLVNVGPFSNLQPEQYWSATEFAPNVNDAFVFYMYWGYQYEINKAYGPYAWAVSSGDVAAVPEADMWVMLLAGLGLVGVATRRGNLAKV